MAKRDKGAPTGDTGVTATEATASAAEVLQADEVAALRAELEEARRSAAQWRAEAELQARNLADANARLSSAPDQGGGAAVRFRGTLKEASEQHFQRRLSSWDHLTVIFDTSA